MVAKVLVLKVRRCLTPADRSDFAKQNNTVPASGNKHENARHEGELLGAQRARDIE